MSEYACLPVFLRDFERRARAIRALKITLIFYSRYVSFKTLINSFAFDVNSGISVADLIS